MEIEYDEKKDALLQYYTVKEDNETIVTILEPHKYQNIKLAKGVVVVVLLKNVKKDGRIKND